MDVNQCKIEDGASESTSSPPSLAFLTSKSKPPTQEPIVLAADTGTTGHFVQKPQHLSYDGPIFNVQQTAIPISVTLPDNSTMTNTHEATLRHWDRRQPSAVEKSPTSSTGPASFQQ